VAGCGVTVAEGEAPAVESAPAAESLVAEDGALAGWLSGVAADESEPEPSAAEEAPGTTAACGSTPELDELLSALVLVGVLLL
jgi:hypothetical protein